MVLAFLKTKRVLGKLTASLHQKFSTRRSMVLLAENFFLPHYWVSVGLFLHISWNSHRVTEWLRKESTSGGHPILLFKEGHLQLAA